MENSGHIFIVWDALYQNIYPDYVTVPKKSTTELFTSIINKIIVDKKVWGLLFLSFGKNDDVIRV